MLQNTRMGKDLTGTLISDLVLQILSYVAENEYQNIKQRQMEGIRAAKANGVKFGRPPKELTEAFYVAVEKWRQGEITMKDAAKEVGLSYTTFYRRARSIKTSNLRNSFFQH